MAKGQPDFFGTPIQLRYGTEQRIASYDGHTDPGVIIDQTIDIKGIFTCFKLIVDKCPNALMNLRYQLWIDTNQLCYGLLYDGIRPTSIGGNYDKMLPEYLDTYYATWVFSFRHTVSVENTIRILLTGLAPITINAVLYFHLYGQRIV